MKIKTIINGTITTILVIALVLALFFVITSKLNGGKPKIAGYEIMTVLSGSMEPGIHTGSIIAIKPDIDKNGLAEGDVITYRSLENPNMLITHRILEVQKSGNEVQYLTKGDANDVEDPKPIPASYIVGQYAGFTVPYFGFISDFMKSKVGIIALMIIPGLLLVLSQIYGMWKMISRMDETRTPEANDKTVIS
ncbi:signal peptidase I SipW [Paenibacillus sp. Soil522]|uniref:signal peptidase I SipW n=1 Tax=Paenibacillus sp. Soil522 TaxID=1736388 RepID=UPI0006F9DD5E|nr:signal peptidase I [Paenibacillus sp. Soil522]KRE51289.1 S26 family signal peptidase [Paenibacillus sp. Soil522]